MSYLDQITVGSTTYDIKDSSAYSSSNQPPYPVTEVNGQTGAVSIAIPSNVSDLNNDSNFVDAAGASAAAPVQSVNNQTGSVSIAVPSIAGDIGAIPSILDSNYYGTTLPTAGTAGRIFFLKV